MPLIDALVQDVRVKEFMQALARQYVQKDQSLKLAALDFASKLNPLTISELIANANQIIDYFEGDDTSAEPGTTDQDEPQ